MILSSIALVIASIVLTYSVFSRYFFHFSTDWQDELSVFLIVGAVFMSGAAVQAQRGHVAIEAIVGLLPARSNHMRQLVVDLASFAVLRLLRLEVLDPARRSNHRKLPLGLDLGPATLDSLFADERRE